MFTSLRIAGVYQPAQGQHAVSQKLGQKYDFCNNIQYLLIHFRHKKLNAVRGFVLKIFWKFLHFTIDEPWRIFLPLRSNETFSPSKHLMEGWIQPFEPEIPNHRAEISLICTNFESSWVLPCDLFEVDNGFISWRDETFNLILNSDRQFVTHQSTALVTAQIFVADSNDLLPAAGPSHY